MVKQTMVHLTEELISRADEEARRRRVSRSALIREALAAYLEDSTEAAIDRAMRAGYDAIPQGAPDEWGDPEEFGRRATADLMSRLSAEEQAAGHEPW